MGDELDSEGEIEGFYTLLEVCDFGGLFVQNHPFVHLEAEAATKCPVQNGGSVGSPEDVLYFGGGFCFKNDQTTEAVVNGRVALETPAEGGEDVDVGPFEVGISEWHFRDGFGFRHLLEQILPPGELDDDLAVVVRSWSSQPFGPASGHRTKYYGCVIRYPCPQRC